MPSLTVEVDPTLLQPTPWSGQGTWTITTDAGDTISGHLPAWAEEDPSENGVPVDQLALRLAGVSHRTFFEGQMMPLVTPDLSAEVEEDAVFEGSTDCNPYAPDITLRQPHVTLQVTAGHWIRGLDPEDLTRIAAQLRAQADLLDHDIRSALIAARDDWATRA